MTSKVDRPVKAVFYHVSLTKQICSDSEPHTTVLKDMNDSHSNEEVVSLRVSGRVKTLRKVLDEYSKTK